jgi:adenosylcobinamide-GDP ribazoletransferase
VTDLERRLRKLPADTLTALAFFSRIPVATPASFDLRQAAAGWPVAGLLLALGPALLLLLLSAADFPALIAAILALTLYAALTGGMHEDGLTDTFDALGGGRTQDARLAIMRDSRLGTFGALALMLTTLLKIAALAAISLPAWHGALALVAVAVVSRSLAVWHWRETLPARRDGMAWSAGQPDGVAFLITVGAAAIAGFALLIVFGVGAVIGIFLAAASVGLLNGLVSRVFGGHTGDTIGAAQQVAEALLFAGLTVGGTSILG